MNKCTNDLMKLYYRSIETKCNNGQCISEEKLCDGRTDCNDGSDETILQCYNWKYV